MKPVLHLPFQILESIETERLRLRGFFPEDFEAFFRWRSSEEVARFKKYGPQSREAAARSFSDVRRHDKIAAEGDCVVFALERREDARVIGEMALYFVSAQHATGEIGWSLHPDFQGYGYATEAANAVFGLAFGAIGLHRMKASLDPRNAPSEALCRRLGMRLEAHHIEDFWCKGEWTDSYIFAILAREWRAMNP